MTDDRINKLNSINFSWDMKRKQRKSTTRDTVKFDVMYNHLVSFKETYGHTKVNKLEKEWKAGNGIPEKKVYRRLPLFLAFARKEKLLFDEGQPCSLDGEKVRMLTELGVEWKKPASEPRKNSGGEASRKKRRRVETQENSNEGGGDVVGARSGGGYHHYQEEGMGLAAVAAAMEEHTTELAPMPRQDNMTI